MAETLPALKELDIGMASETNVIANQIATELDLATTPNLPAVIEAEQQAVIHSIPRLPAPGVAGASQPAISPATGTVVAGSLVNGLPPAAAAALARSRELTGAIANQLQKNLGASASNADAMADAIAERIGADQIIALQTNTEDMKAQNQLIKVVRESTSSENQTRLMDQLHEQAQDVQELLEEREQDAAEGGFGFLIKSALNKEIYGTPGGAKDIEINAGLKQYQSTLAEIQGVTAATESFQLQNAATRELVTEGTIAADTRKIAATGQVELYKVTLEQNRSNAETLRTLLSVSSREMDLIMKGYQLVNSIEGQQIQRERHALDVQKFERQKVMDEVTAQRNKIALRRETLSLKVEQGLAPNKARIQELAINQAEVNLEREIIALTVDDETLNDRLAASKIARAQAETNLDTSLLAFEQAETAAVDADKLAVLRLQLEADKVTAARTILEAEEFEASAAIRLAQKEGALESQDLNNRIQRAVAEYTELVAEGKGEEALAVLEDAMNERADLATVKASHAENVAAYQSFIFGAHAVESLEVINSQLDNDNALYTLMRQLGSARGPNGEFMIGVTPARSEANLTLMEGAGVISNKIPGVRIIREIRAIIQKQDEENPALPQDEISRASRFNAATTKYMQEQEAEIVFGDTTNPLQPPTIPQLVELSPTLAKQPLFSDVLTPSGNVDTNIDTIFAKALQAMSTDIISQEEAVEGVVALGNTIGLNNNVNHHGMQTIGLPYVTTVNMRVMRPRGFGASLLDTISGSTAARVAAPVGLGIITAGLVAASPISLGTSLYPAAITGTAVAGTAAAGTAALGSSDFITLNLVDPVAVRQHMIAILSSSTLGGEDTEDVLDEAGGE